jgi:dipeptidase E
MKLYLTSAMNVTAKEVALDIKPNGEKIKTAFIFTGAEDGDKTEKQWVKDDRQGMIDAGFEITNYTITDKNYEELEKDLSDFEVIHVNGGNTFYLLLHSRKSGFDKFIRKFVENGGIYTGSSAGSILVSPNIESIRKLEDKLFADELKTFEGINLVDFIVYPHFGSEKFKDAYLKAFTDMYNFDTKGILLRDTQFVKVEGTKFVVVDINKN